MNTVSPESVGLSSARLKRVDQVMQKYVDQGKLPGVLSLVAGAGRSRTCLRSVGWTSRPRSPSRSTRFFASTP
jgi:hypothetical protein